ncbi:MAG: hypothetical protein Q9170_008053 [Blastenia crenularia]
MKSWRSILTLKPRSTARTLNELKRHNYLPLDYDHVRLLQVYRDSAARLRCKFVRVHVDRLTATTYTACSYTWGDPTPVSKIWCDDGGFLDLTASAADILTSDAVMDNKVMLWWIDLLCINQQDLEEKATQVGLMTMIFCAAGKVIAWLGKASEDSDLAMEFVPELFAALKTLQDTDVPIEWNTVRDLPETYYPSAKWTALRGLLQRPWFERMWVVQEMIMAPEDAHITCGKLAVEWRLLAATLTLIHVNNLSGALAPPTYEAGLALRVPDGLRNTMLIWNMKLTWNKDEPIWNLLTSCADFQSTDPRDKIYALIGMVDHRLAPLPDYRASTREVFISWAKYMLNTDTSLKVLHYAGIDLASSITDPPSWVSDWTIRHRSTNLGADDELTRYRSSGSSRSCIQFSTDSDCITVRGIILDKIERCISRPNIEIRWNQATFKHYYEALVNWVEHLRDLVNSSQYYHTAREDVVWRTLIGNIEGGNGPPSEEYREYFKTWLSAAQDLAKNGNASPQYDNVNEQDSKFEANYAFLRKRAGLWSKKGLLGLGPTTARGGDLVCIILGANTPFLLRETSASEVEDRKYQLVGECYIHGLMNGEGLSMGDEQDIVLM